MAGCQQRVAGADHADGGDQVFGRDVLEEEAAGSGGQRRVDEVVEVERGQDDHARRVGGAVQDTAGGLQAVQLGHPDVHQDDVGPGAPDGGDGFGSVGRLGDHIDAVGGEDHPEAGTGQRLVVGDHHAQRPVRHRSVSEGVAVVHGGHSVSRGISAVTR